MMVSSALTEPLHTRYASTSKTATSSERRSSPYMGITENTASTWARIISSGLQDVASVDAEFNKAVTVRRKSVGFQPRTFIEISKR